MRPFADIFAMAAARKGGAAALEALLPQPTDPKALAAVPDDRWLAQMSKNVFSAGFNWKVIEAKWPGFEEAFFGFDPGRCAMLGDDDIDRLLADTRIVRHAKKILSVRENANFLVALAREHGSAGKCFADWPTTDHIGLLALLKARGDRLGGNTGQYFLRFMGKDSFVISRDVGTALVREGVVDKPPSSKRDMKAVQVAFNAWMDESGRGLTQISRTLAMSVGD